MEGTVAVEFDKGIATLSFAHPKGNSLPAALLRKLSEQVTALSVNDDARVIVLRSEGTGPFCAGASFDELTAIADAATGKEFFMGFARVILAMIRCPKLIVARVHGKAVGGGVGIIAAADYAIATNATDVKLSELAVGIGPFVVGPVIERKIGLAAYAALAIDAASWRDARWAKDCGLFADVADGVESLEARVDALARTLAASSPEAMRELKRVFWRDTDDWPALLEARAELSGTLVLSSFTRQAIARFKAR
jgi:methylglutaconyl-CoA hydratase